MPRVHTVCHELKWETGKGITVGHSSSPNSLAMERGVGVNEKNQTMLCVLRDIPFWCRMHCRSVIIAETKSRCF